MEWNYIFNRGQKLSDDLAHQIHSVYKDSFGFLPDVNSWSVEGIKNVFSNSNFLSVLQDRSSTEIFGYSFNFVPEEPLFDNTYILWNNASAICKKMQGKGYYSLELFKEITKKYSNKTIGWAGGRSQNPLIYLRYSKLGKLFPFDETYDKYEGRQLMTYLKENIDEVKNKNVDNTSGIAFKAYNSGVLGDFDVNIEVTRKFETQLKQWNFNRAAGDTLVVCVKLK